MDSQEICLLTAFKREAQSYITAVRTGEGYAPFVAHYNLGHVYGRIYELTKDWRKLDYSISHYLLALKYNKSFFEAYTNIGSSYLNKYVYHPEKIKFPKLDYLDNAIGHLKKACDIGKSGSEGALPWVFCGQCFHFKGILLNDKDILFQAVEYLKAGEQLKYTGKNLRQIMGEIMTNIAQITLDVQPFFSALAYYRDAIRNGCSAGEVYSNYIDDAYRLIHLLSGNGNQVYQILDNLAIVTSQMIEEMVLLNEDSLRRLKHFSEIQRKWVLELWELLKNGAPDILLTSLLLNHNYKELLQQVLV